MFKDCSCTLGVSIARNACSDNDSTAKKSKIGGTAVKLQTEMLLSSLIYEKLFHPGLA